jgi:hypothetical protein
MLRKSFGKTVSSKPRMLALRGTGTSSQMRFFHQWHWDNRLKFGK